MRWLGFLVLLAGCDDYVLHANAPDDTDTTAKTGWCAVQQLVVDECTSCHAAGAGALGDLDLETDAYAALVGVASTTDPSMKLVEPGDPEASFFFLKITGEMGTGRGTAMPPFGTIDADVVEAVRAWIADGASDVCDDTIDPGDGFHEVGYAAAGVHGHDAKYQVLPCTQCHGTDLAGVGDIPSCDGCHSEGWRSDCTFCHGDPLDGTGAPPRHISGEDEGLDASYAPHRAHTGTTALHEAFDCSTCHSTPTDVLSPGHLFVADSTAGVAEVDFLGGLSDAARWNPETGTCSNLYCHGNGRGDNGTVVHTADVAACNRCHPSQASGEGPLDTMSGVHRDHVRNDVGCWECHGGTTNAAQAIVDVSLHVNGVKDLQIVPAINRSAGLCSGTCHGESHVSETWFD